MKTLFLSDLDGTLLRGSQTVSQRTEEIVSKLLADGMRFSVATARGPSAAARTLGTIIPNAPEILMNGVLLYDAAERKIVREVSLSPTSVRRILDAVREEELSGYLYALKDGKVETFCECRASPLQQRMMEERERTQHKIYTRINSFQEALDENIIYFNLIETFERLNPLYQKVSGIPGVKCVFYQDVYGERLWFLELFGEKATKGEAVKALRQAYGFDRVVAFGDNQNDLTMFEASDYAVAVENAVSELKERADEICGSNEADGVAEWLKRHAKVE